MIQGKNILKRLVCENEQISYKKMMIKNVIIKP